MLNRSKRILLVAVATVCFGAVCVGQATESDGILRFSVSTKNGEPLSDLTAENFGIRVGNRPYPISLLSQRDEPASIGILIDTSGSKDKKRFEPRLKAALDFLSHARKENEFFVARFSEKPELVVDFSTDRAWIKNSIQALFSDAPKTETAMYRAISRGVQRLAKSKHQKKALIVFSDGIGYATPEYRMLRERMREWCVPIYFVGVRSDEQLSSLEMQADSFMQDAIDTCGGGMNFATKPEQLSAIAEKFAREIEEQYVLGFKFDIADPKLKSGWRTLDVSVAVNTGRAGKPVAHVRRGYFFPKAPEK